jgi:hypothetical protein
MLLWRFLVSNCTGIASAELLHFSFRNSKLLGLDSIEASFLSGLGSGITLLFMSEVVAFRGHG